MLALLVAPPRFFVDEVLKALKGVNWRRLGKQLIGEEKEEEEDFFRDAGVTYTNLDRIHNFYDSDEARLRAVVEEFLTKTDRSRRVALQWRQSQKRSWRRIIWALYCMNEIDKVQQIRSYAEPLQGMLELDLSVMCITRPR